MSPQTVSFKIFEHSKWLKLRNRASEKKVLKLLRCVVDKYWPLWELEVFTCNDFLGYSIVFWRCFLRKSFKHWAEICECKSHDGQSTLRVSDIVTVSCFIATFSSSVVFRKVSSVYPINAQVSQGLWFFKIFDLNWQVRMCCKVSLRLCLILAWSLESDQPSQLSEMVFALRTFFQVYSELKISEFLLFSPRFQIGTKTLGFASFSNLS